MSADTHAHLIRFRRHRRRRLPGRHYRVQFLASAELYKTLQNAADVKRRTIGSILEEAAWIWLRRMTAHKGAKLFERLRYADALITEVIAIGYAIRPAGQLAVGDIHTTETRQRRRNELSAKALEAFDQVYEIAQTEALAEANQLRIAAFEVLAHLAEVNSAILRDASEEEIVAEMEKLREEQRQFEEATRKLEDEAGETSTKK